MKLASPAQIFALVLLLCSSPLIASTEVEPLIPLTSHPLVSVGMSRETVQFTLGFPGATPLPDVWVYWEFKVKGSSRHKAFDSLVVGFKADRVVFLRLCPSESVRALIAQQKARALPSTVEAK